MTKSGRERIVVTEFPYMVNKTKVHEHIVRLVQEKRIEGITAVRDESNREGVRFVIEVRRDASANVILNNLFKMTQMQPILDSICWRSKVVFQRFFLFAKF